MTPSSPITLPPQVDISMNVGDHVQFIVEQAGAFCCKTNANNFNPALPCGLLPAGKWPNPEQYPMGAEALVAGSVAYSFQPGGVGCESFTDVVGKVIRVGSSLV